MGKLFVPPFVEGRERKRNAEKKKERKKGKKENEKLCARISWVSIDNGCVYGEYDRVKN